MKWLALLFYLSTSSAFAEEYGCFGEWIENNSGCCMPVETIVPAENTRVFVKAPVGTQVNLWGSKQPVLKGDVGGYKFYLNPCFHRVCREIEVSIPVDGRQEVFTDQVWLYPKEENVFGYFWDSYSQRILRFQNHDSVLVTIFKVPEDALIYLDDRRKNASGPLRTFSTTRPDGDILDTDVRITVERNGKLITWEENFDFTVGKIYRFTIVYDEQLGELIRREPVRKAKARSKT